MFAIFKSTSCHCQFQSIKLYNHSVLLNIIQQLIRCIRINQENVCILLKLPCSGPREYVPVTRLPSGKSLKFLSAVVCYLLYSLSIDIDGSLNF